MIIKILTAVVGTAILLFPTKTYAQNRFSVNGKVDFVSDYIWRGADQYTSIIVRLPCKHRHWYIHSSSHT